MRGALRSAACLQPLRSCSDVCSTGWRYFTSDSTSYVTQLRSRTAVLVEGQEAAAFLQVQHTNSPPGVLLHACVMGTSPAARPCTQVMHATRPSHR